MPKPLKNTLVALLLLLFLWSTLVVVEFNRLSGSLDAGKHPLLTLGSTQIQNELAEYHSLGFTQRYTLTERDQVVWGEFTVLGLPVTSWTRMIP